MVFVPDEFVISPAQERARYELHHNDPDDEGYRQFLSRLLDEVTPRVPPEAHGLDYGSGPEPALVGMLREFGFEALGYDLYFAPDESALATVHDFITCSETVEHFRRPLMEFDRMDAALAPGGLLAIMTSMPEGDWDAGRFAGWHYPTDETHICYYSVRTMEWLAAHYSWQLRIPRPDVALMLKPERADGATATAP